jgi:hypothetical protein
MNSKIFSGLTASLVLLFCLAEFCQAGFGISPPQVINYNLIKGSHFEQKIGLSRSNDDEELVVRIQELRVPDEIKNWFSFSPEEIIFKKGEKHIYMTVAVDVPKDAKLDNYKGAILILTGPRETTGGAGGGVAVRLGAQIDVDLTVGNGKIFDFLVKMIQAQLAEKKAGPLDWFTNIKILMKIENTGNVPSSPTKVHLDIYDIGEKELLESRDDGGIKRVNPFETKEVYAEFPTRLAEGTYLGVIKIYKNEQIVYEEKSLVKVKEVPYTIKDWFVVIGGGAVTLALAFVLYLLQKKNQFLSKLFRILFKEKN